MTVTDAMMANGAFDIKVIPTAPRYVTDLLYNYFGLVKVFPARIPTDQVWSYANTSGTTPLFTGVILERPDMVTVSGQSAAWFLGDPSSGKGSGKGPFALFPSGTHTLSYFVTNSIATLNGIKAGNVAGTGSVAWTPPASGIIRDALTSLAATFGVEWRLNPNMTLDMGNAAFLYGSSSVVVAAGQAGRDPNVTGLNDSAFTLNGSRLNYVNGVTVNPGGTSTGTQTVADGLKAPDGTTLQITQIVTDTQLANNYQANLTAVATLQTLSGVQNTISLNVNEYAPTDGLVPAGAWIGVYDPDQNLYDTTNPVAFRGATIYPVNVRVSVVTWAVRRGMGVYVDLSHMGGVVTDISDYVEWETSDDQLTIGTTPYMLNLQRNPPH